jgi:uncharacterized protein (DUF1800 family)
VFGNGADPVVVSCVIVHRLATSAAPLHETVSLFFHNHFVSALSKVREGRMMLDQLTLFRERGLSSFTELTKAVTRDPAMVRYLDLERSSRSQPNENFARELLELFTMGPGPYTESDIREAARAFTGHHLRAGRYVFSEAAHDPGSKNVLGVSGLLAGDDVVEVACNHPATAGFLARKLASLLLSDDPAADDVAAIAQAWKTQRGHLGNTIRTILLSDRFFAADNRFAVTRSPIALLASASRLLGSPLAPARAAQHLPAMGQALLDPPTVKGYPGGRKWLNPATLLARRTFLLEAVREARTGGKLPEPVSNPKAEPASVFEYLFGRQPDAAESAALRDALQADPDVGVLELSICHPLFQRC